MPLTTVTLWPFFFARPASDISPPVASPSLMAPAASLARCELGMGVDERLPWTEPVACFLALFREDSFPLDSISERLGEPGRLRLLLFLPSGRAFGLPDVGPAPLVALPDAASAAALSPSSCLTSFSSSESSSDWKLVSLALNHGTGDLTEESRLSESSRSCL